MSQVHLSENPSLRIRVKKACDGCHAARAKCDAADPCQRCASANLPCSYYRTSRRRGRIAKGRLRLNSHVSREQPVPSLSAPSTSLSSYHDSGELVATPMEFNGTTASPHSQQETHDFFFGNDIPCLENPFPTSIVLPDWLMDAWAPDLPSIASLANDAPGSHTNSPVPDALGPPTTSHPMRSNTTSDKRYPVLEFLYGHLSPHLSPALACDLLDAYFADTSPGSCVPASPLLIAHVFRRSSFLSPTNPRSCSPALLSSMLLVASAMTEAPFFGASPTARSQLLTRLFDLTLRLLHQPEDQRKAGRNRFVDQVATYFHLALVSTAAEIGSFASRWWHTAFQLAKEYRLNADICLTTPSPSGVIGLEASKVVDRTDYRFVHATEEEMEERRRIWWTLFLWDKQLALSHNSPVSISSLECLEALVPMADRRWQEPTACTDDDQFNSFTFFLPFGRCLDLLLVRHHSRLRAQLGAMSGHDERMDQTIKNQLSQLAHDTRNDVADDSSSLPTERRDFRQYSRALVRILFVLDARPWDVLDTLANSAGEPGAPSTAMRVTDLIDEAAVGLQELLAVDPDVSCCPLFCDIFLFLLAAITYATLVQLQEQSPAKLVAAAESVVRALESIISTTCMEHQRKMRRLLLLALAKAKWGKMPSPAERTLSQHIAQTYRWSMHGSGLRA